MSQTSTSELPRVAIALAAWNGEAFLREQVLSLLWQKDCRAYVYIRDDGSTDGTLAVVQGLVKDFPDRVFCLKDGAGSSGSSAQNFFNLLIALRDCPCDYVALSDQDDIWEGAKLSRAIERLRKDEADGYSSNLIAFASRYEPPKLIRKDHNQVLYDHLFQTASAGCTYVLSRPLFEVVSQKLLQNQPNPDVAHDILIYAIARSHGFLWYHDRSAHILYRQHGANLVGSRAGLSGAIARWRMFKSGWYRQQTVQLAPYLSGNEDENRVVSAVRRGGWRDRLWLISKSFQCRRRRREALMFAVLQLF